MNSTRAMTSKIGAEAFGTTTRSSLRKASRRTIGAFSTMLVVERINPSLMPSHGRARDQEVDVVRPHLSGGRGSGGCKHVGEDEPIEDNQAQRLEDGPEDAEGRAGEAAWKSRLTSSRRRWTF